MPEKPAAAEPEILLVRQLLVQIPSVSLPSACPQTQH
jgi:hypothetical protein